MTKRLFNKTINDVNKVGIVTLDPNGREQSRTTDKDMQYIHEKVEFRITDSNKVLAKAQFDDMDDFMSFYDNEVSTATMEGRASDHPKGYCGQIKPRGESAWTFGTYKGFDNADDLKDKCLSGQSPKAIKRYIKKFREELKQDGLYHLPDEVVSCKRRRVWTDEGADLDIDAVMSGDPNYWVNVKRDGKFRIVRLVVNYSASGGNDEKTFAKTIASALVTAEIIETLGYGVEIYGASACRTRYQKHIDERVMLMPLKRCTEVLDMERLGYVGSVGHFRYFGFGIEGELFGDWNGSASHVSTELQDYMGADVYISTSWGENDKQSLLIRKAIEKLTEGE
jgi:hypothetical protein